LGIYSTDDIQIAFLDTPGLLEPRYKLQEYMHTQAFDSLEDADVILFLHDKTRHISEYEKEIVNLIMQKYSGGKKAVFAVVLNKIDDEGCKDEDYTRILNIENIFEISALKNNNISSLMDFVVSHLPEHEFFYSPDYLSDRSTRFFVSEIIRKQIFKFCEEELPYSTAVTVEEFDESVEPYPVRAYIYVERASQKGMIIGQDGEMIKKIKKSAQYEIRKALGIKVKLDLWVKIMEKWRKNENKMKYFGYN